MCVCWELGWIEAEDEEAMAGKLEMELFEEAPSWLWHHMNGLREVQNDTKASLAALCFPKATRWSLCHLHSVPLRTLSFLYSILT